MATTELKLQHPKVVSKVEWMAARKQHLTKEKEFTRLRDDLSRQRRELPWETVDQAYSFDGPGGKMTLGDLFEGRSQLMVYHFMMGPGWGEGCKSCSLISDHLDGLAIHLANRDVTLAVVSRAPISEIEAFKKRMGWKFKWVSSFGSEFNYDYHVSFTPDEMAAGKAYYNYAEGSFPVEEAPGASVFSKDEGGQIFHTYSTYGRGLDMLMGVYHFLDLVPKGRDEEELAFSMSWVRHHDNYGEGYAVDRAAVYTAPKPCCSDK